MMANWYMRRCSVSLIIRNGSQNHSEIISLHLLQWLVTKRREITSVDKTAQKKEPSSPVGGNENCCSHYGIQYGVGKLD